MPVFIKRGRLGRDSRRVLSKFKGHDADWKWPSLVEAGLWPEPETGLKSTAKCTQTLGNMQIKPRPYTFCLGSCEHLTHESTSS